MLDFFLSSTETFSQLAFHVLYSYFSAENDLIQVMTSSHIEFMQVFLYKALLFKEQCEH